MDTGRLRVTFHKRHRCLVQTCHSMMPSVALQGCAGWFGVGGGVGRLIVVECCPQTQRGIMHSCAFLMYTQEIIKLRRKCLLASCIT